MKGKEFRMIGNELLINTPLQQGEKNRQKLPNRFSGFVLCADYDGRLETVKAVRLLLLRSITSLKRGVNEMASSRRTSHALQNLGRLKSGSAGFQPAVAQVFNLPCRGAHKLPADWKSAIRQAESLRYELAGQVSRRRFA